MLASAFADLIFRTVVVARGMEVDELSQGWNGLSASFTTFYLTPFLVGAVVAGKLMAFTCRLAFAGSTPS